MSHHRVKTRRVVKVIRFLPQEPRLTPGERVLRTFRDFSIGVFSAILATWIAVGEEATKHASLVVASLLR